MICRRRGFACAGLCLVVVYLAVYLAGCGRQTKPSVDRDELVMETDQEIEKIEEREKNNEEEKSKPQLTMEELLDLVKEGRLNWTDFEMYDSQVTGSGLMILIYPIDDNFSFVIGGSGQGEPMYVRLVNKNSDDFLELGKKEDRLEECRDLEKFIEENRETPFYVNLLAHVKEVIQDDDEEKILISSDSDAYPGVFIVSHVREVLGDEEMEELKGGSFLCILMKKINTDSEGEEEKIPEYKAEEIVLLSEEEDDSLVQEDILLTSPPELELGDLLSSLLQSFRVHPGNYTWTVEENGEEVQTTACGPAPLDEAAFQGKAKLKIPNYSMEKVPYGYHIRRMPDKLTLRQWDLSDMGKLEAKEEVIVVYCDKMGFITLEREKIYELTAEWMKENYQSNKFYATVHYVFATE